MFLHVESPQPLGLVDEGTLLRLTQRLPLRAQPLRDLRVVHLRVLLRHLAPLASRPHHERVHGALHAVRVVLVVGSAAALRSAHPHGAALDVDVVVVRGRGRGATPGAGAERGRVLRQLRVLGRVVGGGRGGRGQARLGVVGGRVRRRRDVGAVAAVARHGRGRVERRRVVGGQRAQRGKGGGVTAHRGGRGRRRVLGVGVLEVCRRFHAHHGTRRGRPSADGTLGRPGGGRAAAGRPVCVRVVAMVVVA